MGKRTREGGREREGKGKGSKGAGDRERDGVRQGGNMELGKSAGLTGHLHSNSLVPVPSFRQCHHHPSLPWPFSSILTNLPLPATGLLLQTRVLAGLTWRRFMTLWLTVRSCHSGRYLGSLPGSLNILLSIRYLHSQLQLHRPATAFTWANSQVKSCCAETVVKC